MAASTLLIAGAAAPAGAASNCIEKMDPSAGGNASGLQVSCAFSQFGVGVSITLHDYADATWHYGAARTVAVGVTRTGAAPGTVSGAVVKACATNNTTAAVACFGSTAAAGQAAGALALGTGPGSDINHSVENPTSSTTLTGVAINPGSFVRSISGTSITLSKPLLTTGWPLCAGTYASGCTSMPIKVLVSNDIGRAVTDGVTTAGSNCVSSVAANFKAGDVGMGLSGGNLPDGATILSFPGTGCGTATTSVNLDCTGCVGGFALVTGATAQVLTLSPANPPTSSRYVTNGSATGTRTLTSLTAAGAVFANTDIGLPISFVPPIPTLAGARVGTITSSTAIVIAGAGVANIPTGAKKFVIGNATKTAPATKDAAGTLSILLRVNPIVSPTSPPCNANKISGFQIPLLWRNPQGTAVLATNIVGASGYNTFFGGTHLSGSGIPAASIAQVDFRTASTSFAGYVTQTYTTTGGVPNASAYSVVYTTLPVGVGVCTNTGLTTGWTFFGLSTKIVENPSFTGGGGGGLRGISSELQGTNHTYGTNSPDGVGDDGAWVSTSATEQPTNANACYVSSPPLIKVPSCTP